MLVLTRKINERIIISTDIVVTVLSIDRDQVKLGVQAPKDISVHREEVFEEIMRSNREAMMDSARKNEIIARYLKNQHKH